MIVGRAFSLLRRRAAQTRRRFPFLVEAEVVQLPLERREAVVSKIHGQRRFEALAVVDDDAAVRVPGEHLALLLEHLVQFDHEIIWRYTGELLGEGTPRGGGASRRRRLGHGLGGACAELLVFCGGRGLPRRAAARQGCGGGFGRPGGARTSSPGLKARSGTGGAGARRGFVFYRNSVAARRSRRRFEPS